MHFPSIQWLPVKLHEEFPTLHVLDLFSGARHESRGANVRYRAPKPFGPKPWPYDMVHNPKPLSGPGPYARYAGVPGREPR